MFTNAFRLLESWASAMGMPQPMPRLTHSRCCAGPEKITGRRFGRDYETWAEWWRNQRKK